jgi:MFS family permease
MAITSGTAINFLSVYVTRLGATALQLGLLSAGPALVGLAVTLPIGNWLRTQPVGQAAFRSAALTRIAYLVFALLPALLPPQLQVWAYIGLVLLMTVPNTGLMVGFNAMYAAAVPPEWRAHVAGIRNAGSSLVFVVSSLVAGLVLEAAPMPMGYQIIFFIGFVGAALSTYHLWFLRRVTTETIPDPQTVRGTLNDLERPGDSVRVGMSLRVNVALRVFTRGTQLLRVDLLRGSYGRIVAALFVFHVALYLPTPVFPLYWVDVLSFSDFDIGVGQAAFHTAVLLGSLQFTRFYRRWGYRALLSVAATLMCSYPLLTIISFNLALYVLTAVIGGLAWSMVAGALGNYLLEQLPQQDRPAYLAWYNMALNAAVLVGSLGGSFLADHVGLATTLLLAGVARALAGVAIWRWR